MIPARVNTGSIEWPAAAQAGKMSLRKPRGVVHHYAPLGFAHMNGNELKFKSCICEFAPLSNCFTSLGRTFGGQLISYGGQRVIANPPSDVAGSKAAPPPANAGTPDPAIAATPPAATKKARNRTTKKKEPEA